MVRGLERRAIFRDDADRADFVARLAGVAEQGAYTVFAWALLPNLAHLLARTGTRPLPRSMWSLLTGYAGAFNHRYTRSGHLCQTRRGLERTFLPCMSSPLWYRGGERSWSLTSQNGRVTGSGILLDIRMVSALDFVAWASDEIEGKPTGG
jgi:hypothetical protein